MNQDYHKNKFASEWGFLILLLNDIETVFKRIVFVLEVIKENEIIKQQFLLQHELVPRTKVLNLLQAKKLKMYQKEVLLKNNEHKKLIKSRYLQILLMLYKING